MNKTDVYMNPGIIVTESGTYIVAGTWIRVPDGTTILDIPKYVNRKTYEFKTIKKEDSKIVEPTKKNETSSVKKLKITKLY